MCDEAVLDGRGVIHHTQDRPEPFWTMEGGLPGWTGCGVLFYASELGLKSCSMAVMPMTRTENPVSCMSCLVHECW